MGFQKNTKRKSYTLPELMLHSNAVKTAFQETSSSYKFNRCELIIKLKPTETSIEYTVKVIAKLNSKSVKIFVINPKIEKYENGNRVPHLYPDGSLCLFYPEYNEWNYNDSWAETLIPWTALWLFYYEIWKETGKWLGGGIHSSKTNTNTDN